MDNNSNIPDAALSLPPIQQNTNQGTEPSQAITSNVPSAPAPSQPAPLSTSTTDAANLSAAGSDSVPTETTTLVAEDVDLIEKEWVERAKEIVHKTKDNPYLQNRALTQLKVDYVKKRYNKDVKMSE